MLEFVLIFVLFYIWHTLGVTIGYHRLLSHRSMSCHKAVEYFWVLAGYLAFEGSPIWWATIHRAHHRYVDTPLDPHAPKYGLHKAHFGWLMERGYPSHIDPKTHSKDLLKDRLYLFLDQQGNWHRAHQLVLIIGIGFRLLILMAFGWMPALASILAGFAVLQIPLMLNIACHIPRLGYKNFATTDDSVNVWWVALLAMGEGWHNNHHALPGSARSGLRWFELDVSWWVICLMKRAGLVQRVNDGGAKSTVISALSTHHRGQHGPQTAVSHLPANWHNRRKLQMGSANQSLDLPQRAGIFLKNKRI